MKILCGFILLALSTVVHANLTQVGEGTARWGLFKIYDAAFFTEADLMAQQVLADNTPARLELCYARALSVENFIEGAEQGLPQVVSVELEQAVQRLHAAYQPVKQGDCYHLEYQPEQGTRLLLNGKTLVQITTPGFKALYFGIWLGERPLAEGLKRDLLSGLKP